MTELSGLPRVHAPPIGKEYGLHAIPCISDNRRGMDNLSFPGKRSSGQVPR